jgi:phosphoadenosine phosphosulfate reductase
MRKIIMVKKLLSSGEPCAKCAQAQEMLEARGVWDQITEVVWAKESDPQSDGVLLGKKYGVDLAPFFIIQEPGQPDRVHQSTLRLIKELSAPPPNERSLASAAPAEASAGNAPGVAPPSEPAAPALSAEEVRRWAGELRDKSPDEILTWGLKRYGEDCGIAFSGAEDVALIDMAARTGLPFRVFCLDTGRLHEETYRFIDRVRAFYGIEIQLLVPQAEPLQALVRKKGLFSFKEDGHGECCGIRKIEPLRRALSQFRAWATGQRRDQSPSTRGEVAVLELDAAFSGSAGSLVKLNPLTFWSSARVWQYIREQRVPYNELHDHGFVSIGCQPCTRPIRPGEHERAARWWWEDATQRECGLHVKKGA